MKIIASGGVVTDTARRDALWGSDQPDTFVLRRDGKTDTIQGFEPGRDLIDLSAFDIGFDSVEIRQTSPTTYMIHVREERTKVVLAPGEDRALDADDFIFREGVADAPLQVHADGAGTDRLRGTTLPDVFIFSPDGVRDAVRRFEDGKDVVDLSAFNVSFADLTITDKKPGRVMVRVHYGDGEKEDVIIHDGSKTLTAADLSADDFIF